MCPWFTLSVGSECLKDVNRRVLFSGKVNLYSSITNASHLVQICLKMIEEYIFPEVETEIQVVEVGRRT